ncbi:MAG TPA: hypothetical protein ENJ40_05680 [Thermosulfurimonas dismutans]|uniref:Uncharacterized protein n=1 Tax=Thermosulfurimonas dismutans TaxID=999894 RepID=A0A7C3CGD8_9BACT|nr:hypothetical protein [Thermosulfurimonas dismutans]
MIKYLKVGDQIFQNIAPKTFTPVEFDEQGDPIQFEEQWTIPELANEAKARECFIDTLNWLTDRYFYAEAKARGGYLNMGEIEHDAAQGDSDAQFLRQLYDAVWAKEEELEAELSQMTLQQLLELDLESWARSAYDQVKANLETQSGGTA